MDGPRWGTLGACHWVIVGVALTSDPAYRHKFLVCLRRLFLGLAANVPLYAGESPARFSRSLSLLASQQHTSQRYAGHGRSASATAGHTCDRLSMAMPLPLSCFM